MTNQGWHGTNISLLWETDPIGAIVGGAAGILGGLFGQSEAKKQAKKQLQAKIQTMKDCLTESRLLAEQSALERQLREWRMADRLRCATACTRRSQ